MSLPTSAEQACNQALARLGYPERIGNIYEGTRQARVALEVYSQTRDELLRQNDFDFAERNLSLTLLKQAPKGGYIPPAFWTSVYPPLPWLFEYNYPNDCLKVRSIKPQAIFVMDFDPQPVVFTTANDATYNPVRQVLLCNIPNAIVTYTAQITDLTAWDVDTVEAFLAALGRRLAPALKGLDSLRIIEADEQAAAAQAEKEQG